MDRARQLVAATLNRVLAIGGVLGLVAVFEPDVRKWMSDNGLMGWVAALILVVLLPSLASLEARSGAVRSQWKKDVDLISERLGGWNLNSEFFRYITEEADHDQFPVAISQQIHERLHRWANDDRKIRSKSLRVAFDSLNVAVAGYVDAIDNTMDVWDQGAGTRSNPEYLRVPVEWQLHDRSRWIAANGELEKRRWQLIESLRNLVAEVHSSE